MTNQEIFEILADNEERLFYALCSNKDNKALQKAHASAKQTLEEFARATGCHNWEIAQTIKKAMGFNGS